MTTVNDQMNQFWSFQKEALEPMRAFNGFAAEAFERVSRQNYAVLGDFINFAVEQARLAGKSTDASEYFARQMEQSRAFGEQLVRRSQEYLEIAGSVQAKATQVTQTVTQTATKSKAA
jgi:phasin family protein